MSFFAQDSFRDFVRQCLQHKECNNDWEFYVKSSHFTVYRRPAHDRNPSLFEYRSIGGWPDVKPSILAHVYLDLEFRKKWDKNMQSHQRFTVETDLEEEMHGHTGNHFEMRYPWPLANRDYAYTIERKLVREACGKVYQVILGESLPSTIFPERKGIIRINTYMQNICITADEEGEGCVVFMDYFDDPKGSIPRSVINWAARTGVPTFINNLREACYQFEKEHPNGVPLDDAEMLEL